MDNDLDLLREDERANILVVDDRPDKRLVYQTILEDLGQNLFVATSGEQALKQVLERDFAVILLDVNMPGLDGLETAAMIRSRKRSAHIPIIFITADYGDEAHTAKGYSIGAVDYIASPVVPEILRAKVRVFVDMYLLAQQAKRQAQERIALAEEKAARAVVEQASRRLAFLAQASAALAGSLDFAATTGELARLVVPYLADVCALKLAAGEGEDGRSEAAWVGEAPQSGVLSRAAGDAANRWLEEAVERVKRTGKAESFVDPHAASANAPGDPAVANLSGLPAGFSVDSLVVVPLLARGRTLGVLLLGLGPSGRRFDEDTLSVASDLASRAAIALDNARLYKKIREEDRQKDEFLAMLAHELRNPLAPISNAVHVLQTSEQDSSKLTWAREVISRQVKQMVRLVDDLLDVSRITRGKIELKIGSIDVAQVVAAAVETSRPYVDAFEHSLTVMLPPEPLRVTGDFARVAQVLANLINNAAKYTEKAGRISVTVAREETEVVFRVRDSGMGIAKEQLSTIFEPFAQIDRTLDRAQGGLGIGLTLVRRLVEMQGGSASAHSEGKGLGSEFTVRLPAALPERRVKESAGDADGGFFKPSLQGLSVLVVDDNRDVAESTAVLLGMTGCETHLAFDGKTALQSVQTLRPDAVLLDIGLPGMDGYRVAEHIRSQPENRRTLIIGVSGYGQEEHRLRSKSAGFDYHLVKPLDPVVLTSLLASLRSYRQAIATENVVSFPGRKTAD